jgi:dolichol-phosphate mannosyltransferase
MTESKATRRLTRDHLVSIVIPCHNEAEVLPLLFERVNNAAAMWDARLEVILVDDGSRDDTWQEMCALHERDPRWKLVQMSRNFGHQTAVWTGLKHVTGDLVAVLDADLQDPPEVLTEFFDRWEAGYDVIYAVRRKRKEGLFKRLAYHGFYRMMASLAEISMPLDSGDFCVMDRDVVEVMLRSGEMRPFVRGIRAWVGFRQIGVEYERDERQAGEISYTLPKLFALATDGIISFSTRPLRLATWMGLSVSVVALLGCVFTLFQRIFADQFAAIGLAPVPGYATIVMSILFLGGVQLICLGILGEYVGRIYENVKGRPQYVVGQTVGFTRAEALSRCELSSLEPVLLV